MNDWRKDPFSDRWVIMAQHRAARPYDFEWQVQRRPDASCPFCVGQESQTPEPVLVLRDRSADDQFPWHVRVVPNRYPAVEDGPASTWQQSGPLCGGTAPGVHEVLIESPEHDIPFAELPLSRLALCFEAVRQRFSDWRREGRFGYALMFKNVGPLAGASLEHPHSQLMALGEEPLERGRQLALIDAWTERTGQCLACDVLAAETREATRILGGTDRFLAYCPYASRFPYEVRIMHRWHQRAFEDAEAGELRELSVCVQRVLIMLARVLGFFSYNLILHTAPFDTKKAKHYHWYLEVFPRVTMTAGFEWGSGYFLNTTTPEKAAAALRNDSSPENHNSGDLSVWKNW